MDRRSRRHGTDQNPVFRELSFAASTTKYGKQEISCFSSLVPRLLPKTGGACTGSRVSPLRLSSKVQRLKGSKVTILTHQSVHMLYAQSYVKIFLKNLSLSLCLLGTERDQVHVGIASSSRSFITVSDENPPCIMQESK